jgi:hypothetical protein
MYKLVYQSVASPNISVEDICNISESARVFNKANDITGFLIYYNFTFIQILESSKSILEELFFKIKQDKRNYDIQILYESSNEEKTFLDWNMAYSYNDVSDNSVESKLFKSNLIFYCESLDKVDDAALLFLRRAELLLEEKD